MGNLLLKTDDGRLNTEIEGRRLIVRKFRSRRRFVGSG